MTHGLHWFLLMNKNFLLNWIKFFWLKNPTLLFCFLTVISLFWRCLPQWPPHRQEPCMLHQMSATARSTAAFPPGWAREHHSRCTNMHVSDSFQIIRATLLWLRPTALMLAQTATFGGLINWKSHIPSTNSYPGTNTSCWFFAKMFGHNVLF